MTLDYVLAATRDVAPPSPEALAHGRAVVLAAAHEEHLGRARIGKRRARGRMMSVGALAAAAAVAAVLAAVLAVPDGDDPGERTATPSVEVVEVEYENAAQIVSAAAVAAGHQSSKLGDAPYWKVSSEWRQSDPGTEDSFGKRTIWQGIDGPGVLRNDAGEFLELPRATLTVGGRTYNWREINAGALSRDQIRALLTASEDAMSAKDGRPAHEWYYFKQAGELLSESPASPAIRKMLWQELATVTGVTTSGKATDLLGRKGWNLTFKVAGHGSQRFIVDPTTGAILQAEHERRGSTYRVTYFKAGPADSVPIPNS